MDNASSRVPRRQRFVDVRHVASTASTNADVMALGRNGEAEGVVIIADQQTAGRGRHGRTWVASPGSSLLMSLLLRPPAAAAPLVTAGVALAARAALRERWGVTPELKWPNDLIVADPDNRRDRKLAGILAEVDWPAGSDAASGYRPPASQSKVLVAVGIGINVHTQPDAPEDVRDRAVALDTLMATPPALDALADSILDAFSSVYDTLLTDRDEVLDQWRRECSTIGKSVRVDLGIDDVEGRAETIDDDGRLVVALVEGSRRAFSAGDVVHLRRG